MAKTNILDGVNPALPSIDMSDYDNEIVASYLATVHKKNSNTNFNVGTYAHGSSALNDAYIGGSYSPTQNRIYFSPWGQATNATWHYVDCETGSVVGYTHGASGLVGNAYPCAIYSPTQDRIYLIPFGQSDEATWHYIDCADGSVNGYAHGTGITTDAAFTEGIYSPSQNRIYLSPTGISDEATWYYIDCTSTGSVVAYAHGIGVIANNAYIGGAWSPNQDRIYFVPYGQGNQTNWHYIDCSDGSVNAYAHGTSSSSNQAYVQGVYCPTQDRIYLIPYDAATTANWQYIDCSTGDAVDYAHGYGASFFSSAAWRGGTYSPVTNRIYLSPYASSSDSTWYYIDCTSTGHEVIGYEHGAGSFLGSAFSGFVYSPRNNKLYFVPRGIADENNWCYIQEHADTLNSVHLAMFLSGY